MIDVGLTSIIINVHSHIVRGNSTGQEKSGSTVSRSIC